MTKKIVGPITFDMYVHVQSEDGSLRGKVTVGLPPGRVPTEDSIYKAIGQALNAIEGSYVLMEPDNFVSVLIEEKTGQRGEWAAPGYMRYDAEDLVARATKAVEVTGDDD